MFKELLLGVLLAAPTSVTPPQLANKDVPNQLAPWINWVKVGYPDEQCYGKDLGTDCFLYNYLKVDITANGADFELAGQNQSMSPKNLELIGNPNDSVLTLKDSKQAAIGSGPKWNTVVPSGPFVIKGHLNWNEQPQVLNIPEKVGIISINDNGRNLYPNRDNPGQIILRSNAPVMDDNAAPVQGPVVNNKARLKVLRQLRMDRPVKEDVIYNFSCSVKGQLLVVNLPKALQLEEIIQQGDGQLLATPEGIKYRCPQGRSTVMLKGRLPLDTKEVVAIEPIDDNLVIDSDVVVFNPNAQRWENQFDTKKSVQIEGSNANVPSSWLNSLSTVWKVGQKGSIAWTATELNQQSSEKARIQITRDYYPTTMGRMLVKDDLKISNNQLSAIAMVDKNFEVIGAVSNKQASLIYSSKDKNPQFSLTNNNESLQTDMLWAGHDSNLSTGMLALPAGGYDQVAQKGTVKLYLQPGWVPLLAMGGEETQGDYLSKLSLYDLLLAVLAFVLVYLASWKSQKSWLRMLGALAAAVVTVINPWLEDEFSMVSWLCILSGLLVISLLGHLKEDHAKLRKVGRVIITLIIIPTIGVFISSWPKLMVSALHPESDYGYRMPYSSSYRSMSSSGSYSERAANESVPAEYEEEPVGVKRAPARKSAKRVAPPSKMELMAQNDEQDFDEEEVEEIEEFDMENDGSGNEAKIQPKMIKAIGLSSPGDANGLSITWRYNSPLKNDSVLKTFLVGPFWRGLGIFTYLLLAIFSMLMMVGINKNWFKKGTMASILILGLLAPGMAKADDYPSDEMLYSLHNKLAAPTCNGACQYLQNVIITINPDNTFTMSLEANNVLADLTPIPAPWHTWQVKEVQVQGKSAPLVKNGDYFYTLCPAGRSQVEVKGVLLETNQPMLTMPLDVNNLVVKSKVWHLDSAQSVTYTKYRTILLAKNGQQDEEPELAAVEETKDENVKPVPLSRALEIIREVSVDDEINMFTSVRARGLTKGDLVEVPLQQGEVVNGYAEQIHDGKISMVATGSIINFGYYSTLPKNSDIILAAMTDSGTMENWEVSCSQNYHCESSLPIKQNNSPMPWKFEPAPGEKLTVKVGQLPVLSGNTSEGRNWIVDINAGPESTTYDVSGEVVLSAMEKVFIELPADAKFLDLNVNGQDAVNRPDSSGKLSLLLGQGSNNVKFSYTVDRQLSLKSEVLPFKVSVPLTNTKIEYSKPHKRVILWAFGGDIYRPVVKIWGVLLAHALFALIIFLFCRRLLPELPMGFGKWLLLLLPLASISSFILFPLVIPMLILALPVKEKAQTRWARLIGIIVCLLVIVGTLISSSGAALLSDPDVMLDMAYSRSDLSWLISFVPGNTLLPEVGFISLPLYVWKGLQFVWCVWLIWLCKGWYPLVAKRIVSALHRDPAVKKSAPQK